MNSNAYRTPWMRTLGNISYMLGVAFLIASLAMTAFPAASAYAQGNGGSIWTTTGSCGSPQDANSYAAGDHLFIHGSGFEAGDYDWYIKGKPGGASGDPGTKVAHGTVTVDAGGGFCFDAYTVHAGDWGEYSVKVGNKGDNYNVAAAAPTTVPPTNTPTATPTEPAVPPTATPTDPAPGAPVQPTATPTDTPTDTPTPEPGQVTVTPTDPPVGAPTDVPTESPTSAPTDAPSDTPVSTPAESGTATELPIALTVSSFCGPNAKHIDWWTVSNPHGYVVAVSWEVMPSGAPADFYSLPANSEYEFSTIRATDHDTLVVYLDSEGRELAGSAAAAQDCVSGSSEPSQTTLSGNPDATLASVAATALMPVTGADLGSSSQTRSLFLSLGLGFLGLGLVLDGISRERKGFDI